MFLRIRGDGVVDTPSWLWDIQMHAAWIQRFADDYAHLRVEGFEYAVLVINTGEGFELRFYECCRVIKED